MCSGVGDPCRHDSTSRYHWWQGVLGCSRLFTPVKHPRGCAHVWHVPVPNFCSTFGG